MINVNKASEIIKKYLPDFGETVININELSPGILTEKIQADRDYPPAHRVMMDGIGLSCQEYNQGRRQFPILGVIAAGDQLTTLSNLQSCVEIMTGAVPPENCDLIIPYEDIEIKGGIAHIVNDIKRKQYDYIHLKGSDCQKDSVILPENLELNGPRWGIIASAGKAEVKSKKTPKIKIISTGNELIEVEETPLPHQLRRSNIYALKASLIRHNFTDITLDHVRDNPQAIIENYQKSTLEYDLLIYSGGVSKGKFDYLPTLWQDLGVTKYIQGVAQKPGKPLWFGVDHQHQTAIFGLPGNPISSLICLRRYVLEKPPIYAQLTSDFTFEKDLTFFLPAKLNYNTNALITAEPLPAKNSGEFVALAQSDGFLELPQDQAHFKAGQCFPFYCW